MSHKNTLPAMVCLITLAFVLFIPAAGQESIWTKYNSANSGLPNESVKCITSDLDGNIWVGTYMNGIGRLSSNGWTTFNTDNSDLPHNYINCITVDDENRVWAGTDGGGIAVFENDTWTVYNLKNSGLPSNVVMDIKCASRDVVWIATYFDGLVKYVNNQWITFNTGNSELRSNKVISLAIDTLGVVWVGTHGGGLVSYNGTNWRVFTESNSKLPSDYIYSIAIDENNFKWIGTGGAGIALYNDIFWEIFDTHNSGLSDNNIRPLVAGSNGFIWAGTYLGGLSGFNGYKWFTFNHSNSEVPDDEINSLYYAPDSALWIGTERNGLLVMKDNLTRGEIIPPEDLTITSGKEILFDRKNGNGDHVTSQPQGDITPIDIFDFYARNKIFVVFDVADFHTNPSLERQYLRALKIILHKRETVGVDYGVYFTIFSSNSKIRPESFTLSEKEKEQLLVKSIHYLDDVANYQTALETAYELLTSSFVPEGKNQVIAFTYYDIKGNEESIKNTLKYNLDENYITFSLLSFGPITWKDEVKLRNLIPRGGGQYYKIEPVKMTDNWSGTFQLGISLFRGDLDLAKPVTFPGEFGFAMNKKVLSTVLLTGGIKGQFNIGEFSGEKRGYSFENKYKEACINFQVILNSWINRNYKFEKIRPYGFLGIGLINYRTLLRDNKNNIVGGYGYVIPPKGIVDNGNKPEKKAAMTELIFPVGAGANFRLNDLLTLETEFSTRYIRSDKLDGWVAKKDDKYLFFSVGITYKLKEAEFLSNILSR